MADNLHPEASSGPAPSLPSRRWRRLFAAVFLTASIVYGWLELRQKEPAAGSGGGSVQQSLLTGGGSRKPTGRLAAESSDSSKTDEVAPTVSTVAGDQVASASRSTDNAGASAVKPAEAELPIPSESAPVVLTEDDRMRAAMLGTWTREYSGRWTMTIRDDGTGVMTAVPDRVWALIVGPKITIDMTWSVVDGRVIFDSIKGDPESSFKVVMKIWKAHQDRKLIEVNDEQLVYLSDDGKSHSKWTRVVEKSE